jgi:Fibronectin type III domain
MVDIGPAAAAPAPPTNLRVEGLTPEEMTLTWDPVAGAAEYKVAVIPLEPADGYARTDTDDPTVHLDDLTWDVPYKVTVRAFVPAAYPNWYSETSTIVAKTPLPEGYFAPSAPTDLRITRDSQGRLDQIRWDAADGFGPLTYFLHMESADQPDLTGMFGHTTGLSFDLDMTPLVGGWLQSGESVSIWITAVDQIRNQAASQRITLTCCPL